MRELKFRVWLIAEKKMYKVLSCRFYDKIVSINKKGKELILPLNNGKLMQYTGLKDKNGQEIYEGDIYIYPDCHNSPKKIVKNTIIEKSETYGMGHRGTNLISGFIIDGYYGEVKNIEVIGNIYENKEK